MHNSFVCFFKPYRGISGGREAGMAGGSAIVASQRVYIVKQNHEIASVAQWKSSRLRSGRPKVRILSGAPEKLMSCAATL
jgi:hypothetical protein